MMNFNSIQNPIYAWASVKGPGHKLYNLPNQDACGYYKFAVGELFVVSDGVGSKPHSEVGSKAVVKSVFDAAKKFSQFPQANAYQLIKLIHDYWELYILPYKREDCAATCLFTLLLDNGRCVMGQIGDGGLYFKLGSDHFVLRETDDDYANVTTPISSVRSVKEWAVQDFTVDQDFAVLLCTDGVSEDLPKELRFRYIDHLVSKIQPFKTQKQRNKSMRRMLAKWDNPHNQDDKSILVYSRKALNKHDENNN
nr:PP2C family serine/threonine-protein phosphatase [uncultured Lysinibacillus sp.]